MLDRKRNEVVIPFNKDRMMMRDMERAVGALEAIIVRWHAANEKRQAIGAGDLVDDTYDQLTDEFFWDVNAQINQFSTWKLEEDKKND
jgi:predicted transcriptional regulator